MVTIAKLPCFVSNLLDPLFGFALFLFYLWFLYKTQIYQISGCLLVKPLTSITLVLCVLFPLQVLIMLPICVIQSVVVFTQFSSLNQLPRARLVFSCTYHLFSSQSICHSIGIFVHVNKA